MTAPAPFACVAIVGAGAVGSFFGARLALAGQRVILIGRAAHVQAIRERGLRLQTASGTTAVHVEASTDLAAAREADLVLFCVKAYDVAATAAALAPHLRSDAIVLSLQNGMGSLARLREHLAVPVLPTVVYAATALPQPGTVRHLGGGELRFGATERPASASTAAVLTRLVALFTQAGLTATAVEDIRRELWSKLLVNCAYNAISALAQAPYADFAKVPAIGTLQAQVVDEVLALAAAEGVPLDAAAARAAVATIAVAMPAQRSSTAQDLARGKPTEIDDLNGFVARRSRERGLAAPANQALHALVKLAEAARSASAGAAPSDTRAA